MTTSGPDRPAGRYGDRGRPPDAPDGRRAGLRRGRRGSVGWVLWAALGAATPDVRSDCWASGSSTPTRAGAHRGHRRTRTVP